MGFVLYFDYAALVILIFLTASIILKKQVIGTSNKLYLLIIGFNFAATVLDILASMDTIPLPVLFFLNTLFMFSRAGTAVSIFLYASNLGKILHRLLKKKWILFLLLLPFLTYLVLLILNFGNKWVFDYLEGPKYVRGSLGWAAYAISYFYVSLAVIIIIYTHKYHMKSQLIAVLAAFLLQISSSAFQLLVPNILVEMFIGAITLLTLSLFIESPENFIDFKTMAFSYRYFTVQMGKQFDIKEPFTIIFIKITNSGALYNLYSHDKAVAYFRACNAALSSDVKKIDKSTDVYFLGDACFAYFFTNRGKDDEINHLIYDRFSRPMSCNGISFQFTAKTCLVNCPEDCKSLADLIAFSTTFSELTSSHCLDIKPYRTDAGNLLFELDHLLERAIHKKAFSVYYQGIYSLKEKRFVAAEALVRLKDETYGLIMPGLMIPYAESCGKIVAIGKIVMEKSFDLFATHLRGKIHYIEVNLSPLQLMDTSLIADIQTLAKEYGIAPSEVVFEVTESDAVKEDPTIEANLKAIQAEGYKIAIDDFGTGYSNISRIMQLDLSVLKFDRSMTDVFAKGDQDDFFRGLFDIFSKRNVKILFEGVETKEVSDKLESMNVDHIQGYYYSKTIPAPEFLKLLEEKNG